MGRYGRHYQRVGPCGVSEGSQNHQHLRGKYARSQSKIYAAGIYESPGSKAAQEASHGSSERNACAPAEPTIHTFGEYLDFHAHLHALVDKGLLPPERARMLRGWVHSGFNVHRGRRVLSREREDIERLAQYIIRNPFSGEKM